MKNVILLFGGESEERMVSVASAQNLASQYDFSKLIFQNRNGSLFNVSKQELLNHKNVFTDEFEPKVSVFAKNLEEAIPSFGKYVLFLGLHGSEGENGQVQLLLEKNKIFFTGSGSKASHTAFEKKLAKDVISDTSIKLAPGFKFKKNQIDSLQTKLEKFLTTHKKIVLKPTTSGSSFGLYILSDFAELKSACDQIKDSAFDVYLAEAFIQGRELTVGVVQIDEELISLPASEIILNKGRTFDYQGKYLGQGSTEITPAILTLDELQEVQKIALDAHIAFGCYGYSRTDVILTSDGAYFLETNTLPGLSKPSFLPQQLLAADITFNNFIESQIHLAEQRYE